MVAPVTWQHLSIVPVSMRRMEHRIVELETKISYQDHIIAQLNEVVTSQQQQLDALEKAVAQLRQHLKQSGDHDIARPEEEVPPPHY